MNTVGIAVAALGSGIPDSSLGSLVGSGYTPAEVIAALGAVAVGVLGVLIIRILADESNNKPSVSASPHQPNDSGVKRAA